MERHINIMGVVLPASQISWISQEGWTPTQEKQTFLNKQLSILLKSNFSMLLKTEKIGKHT